MIAANGVSSSPLLGLPPAVRRQIYLELGVWTGKIIDLSLRVQRPYVSGETINLVRLNGATFILSSSFVAPRMLRYLMLSTRRTVSSAKIQPEKRIPSPAQSDRIIYVCPYKPDNTLK